MPLLVQGTPIDGVYELHSQRHLDERGAFTNFFRLQEPKFADVWGDRPLMQVNLSRSEAVGTIRGLHFQASPYSEAKLIRCLRGRVWDVAVDLRVGSTTFGWWHAVELAPDADNALLIPEGCAHGFQSLEPGSEILYLHSGQWVQEAEAGVNYSDPSLAIPWPLEVSALSDRDANLPFLK